MKRSLLGLLLVAITAAAFTAPSSRSAVAAASGAQAGGFPGGPYFNVVCGFSHRNNDDPIVYPSQPGRSHNHTYTGNLEVDAMSTPTSLRGGATTCDLAEDASGYWAPTLFVGREPILPLAGIVYYVRRTQSTVEPFPLGLKMIAGNAMARRAQPKTIVSWGCGGIGGSKRLALIPACSGDQTLELRVQFPSCWNGKTTDSPDHKRHMAYSVGGTCPASHPVAVPTMLLIFLYPPVPRRAQVASGRFGTHADFMNGWEQTAFSKLVSGLNY